MNNIIIKDITVEDKVNYKKDDNGETVIGTDANGNQLTDANGNYIYEGQNAIYLMGIHGLMLENIIVEEASLSGIAIIDTKNISMNNMDIKNCMNMGIVITDTLINQYLEKDIKFDYGKILMNGLKVRMCESKFGYASAAVNLVLSNPGIALEEIKVTHSDIYNNAKNGLRINLKTELNNFLIEDLCAVGNASSGLKIEGGVSLSGTSEEILELRKEAGKINGTIKNSNFKSSDNLLKEFGDVNSINSQVYTIYVQNNLHPDSEIQCTENNNISYTDEKGNDRNVMDNNGVLKLD